MSLTGSLSNALTGLSAASRAAEIVSANVANAMTPGYGRREVALSAQVLGGSGAGVTVDGVIRTSDPRATAARRDAESSLANASAQSKAWLGVETAIGRPSQSGSLSDLVNRFEAALVSATSRPDETMRLDAAVGAANDVGGKIRTAASTIQSLRMEADADISAMVSRLNDGLVQVADLNAQIMRLGNGGKDVSALLDQRQRVIDGIAGIVPVVQADRAGGTVALFTKGGASLIDGTAGVFGFDPAGMITPDMTVGSGGLSGLTLNGVPLVIDGPRTMIDGGALAGAFATRDRIAPEAQAGLDAFARDLVERFQDSGLDMTLASGDAGLFTDRGAAFDPMAEIGLSTRIAVNAAVDPAQGGASWRLRDGLGAASPGPVGDSALLDAMASRLAEIRSAPSGPTAGLPRSSASLAADVLSVASVQRDRFDARTSFDTARVEALTEAEFAAGVDTDDELQKLLLVEQAYAANARVIQTVEMLLDTLMEI